MSEKLISADRVLFLVKRDSDLLASCGEEQTVDDVIAIIKSAPAVDAVNVVQCKDCIYNENGCCTRSENYDDSTYRPDYFCADGERRNGNAAD